ncbi:CBO0543 family protein [Paenibacillus sp. NPDC056579]|uniref:CBO0543 family protein n=1 Tax=Paenibacillus sp. NPDC056579 TaxID=3345871 RepID=UPI0036A36B5C
MTLERLVLIAIWVLIITAIVLFIPRKKRREAVLAFLACQAVTWVNSTLHVQFGLLQFPVREFPKASELLFTSEYMMYPVMCAFYYIYEPKSGKLPRLLYLAACITCLCVVDTVIEKYTELIKYTNYSVFLTWIDFVVIFLITNIYCKWYFKTPAFNEEKRVVQ